MIRRSLVARALTMASTLTLASALPTAAAERSEIPAQYKWDLTALYASDAAWDEAKAAIESRIPEVGKLAGTLGGSAAALHTGLTTFMDLQRDLQRLYTYASQKSDEDTRVSKYAEMRDNAGQLFVKLGAASAYVRPELLAIGADKINGFVKAEPKLVPYKPYLDDVLRYAPHTLSASEEGIVAQAGRMAGSGNNVRNILNNAELPWPTITLANGEKIRLDDAAYTQYRQSANRADRDSVFRAFWKAHVEFQNTYGAMVNSGLQDHVFNKEVRKFGSCLEASTFGDNIPPRVYTQLMADVNANLPTLHRYLKLRQRMMGLDKLRYEDLYAPIVKEVSMTYTPEQAQELTLAAVAPLGDTYVSTMRRSFNEGWIDWMPSTGKSSGAYSTGAYGVHPYQLQNFTGLYDEVGTLAHESGHSMHTYFASTTQPFVTSNYATFVAEVASTLNENLLFHHMLDKTKDKPTRLFLLGSYLDNLRGTLFRQTMFAEFELAIHERAEKGETLSGETMTGMYLDLVRKYYGHDQGVCEVDSLYGVEWTYIPHFFYNFYVYQYATSLVASTALANGIHEERRAKKKSTARRDAYLRMLSAGSSKYPIDLLKDAGVDMTTSVPFQAAIKEMNAVIDEIEKLLAAK